MRIVLVDFRSQVYRALYTRGQPLTSPSGEPTRGTYYFTKILLQLLRDLDPTHVLVAEDSRTSWRKRLYPQYKAGRHQDRDEDEVRTVQITMKRCRQVVELLGLRFVVVKGYEADDLVASAAWQWPSERDEVVVVSRDKDLHQVVNPWVSIYDPQDGKFFREAEVLARWGVPPKLVRDVQALTGDPTDNVPGIHGVGPKTAAKWVLEHGSAKAAIRAAEDLPERFQEAIAAFDFRTIFKLVTLDRKIRMKTGLRACSFRGPDLRATAPLFRELGFRSIGS